MEKFIKGSFRRSIYKSESGYMVGLFKIRETNDEELLDYVNETVTFTGFFHDLNTDDTYTFFGKMIDHDRYGIQYEVSSYERVKPEGKEGLIEFLSSDIFSGVGEKLASKIVEKFGNDTLNRIKTNPQELLLIKGMNEKKANNIYETILKYEESEDIIINLCDLGFSTKEALLIYKRYGNASIKNVNSNIYDLIEFGFYFQKIDNMRSKLSIENNDVRRVNAIILYILEDLTFKSGDTYLYKEELLKEISKSFGIDNIDFSLNDLNSKGKIIIEEDKYYLKTYYDAELISSKFFKKLSVKEATKIKKLDRNLEDLQSMNNIEYNDDQKTAIKASLTNHFSIITGGPGTGKTTIVKAIVELFQMINDYDYDTLNSKVALIAPTGRAAKRMSESIMLPAYTIHRFLKWNKDTDSFAMNEFNKSKVRFVIIDEASMIDTILLSNLIKALEDDVKVVMVGDYNQLPSVSQGQVLKDLIDSEIVDIIRLNILYRQDKDSYIPYLASEIKDNLIPSKLDGKMDDFKFLECSNFDVKKVIETLVIKALEKGYTEKDIQILSPMYKGENGIDSLNLILQNIFNKHDDVKKEYKHSHITYRENDKVLQLVNMPDENVFNGDVGYIKHIKYENESNSGKVEILVDFDSNLVRYYPKDLINLTHAYAISIHKSQGSEFKIVIMPIVDSYKRMLYKKIIYTGITRAKSSLILVGNKEVFKYGISLKDEQTRKTSFKDMLTK